MVHYSIPALISQFDRRRNTSLTGKMSSLLGESMVLDVLGDALTRTGRKVELIEDSVPHRDRSVALEPSTRVRDLDGWLRIDDHAIAAVEVKNWTASSLGGIEIIDDDSDGLRELALRRWGDVCKSLHAEEWDGLNKIAMPVRSPAGYEIESTSIERYLAMWYPVSSNGISWWSTTQRTFRANGQPHTASITVFSASLYLRHLLNAGITQVPAVFCGARQTAVVTALNEIVRDDSLPPFGSVAFH